MTSAVALGLFAALASAVALNWGYVAQHGAASALPPLSLRRPLRSLRSLFADRRWLAGFLVGIGGWVLYVAALRVAPLSLVQAVSAGGIGILALLAWRLEGWRPGRRELASIALALGGLVALAGSFVGGNVEGGHGGVVPVAAWLAGSVALAALVVGAGGRLLRVGVSFGIAAGVLYAAGDVATKAAVGGGGRVLFVLALLACHGLAFVALQLGFQRGSVLATAGLSTLFTNAVPIVAGIALFGEGLPGGAAGVVRAVAFAAVVVGGAGLARDGAVSAAQDVASLPRPFPARPVMQASSSR